MDLSQQLTFGFEQTFTTPDWWSEPGFVSTSDTPLKRQKMLDMANALAPLLGESVVESVDIWGHMQYEVGGFFVTMDPGSIEVKTPPCLLGDVERINGPMFDAAEAAGLVPWRNWWYGVKGGTEGGCHVNMGGFSPETNPLRQDPRLLVRYFAWLHNHPEFHYPFMGPDTGPGGNAQRMDEYPVVNALAPLAELLTKEKLTAHDVREALKETTLVKEKSSMPSLTKFKGPDYLLEDRGQEAPHTVQELKLVCEWRMRLFETLLEKPAPELQFFPEGYWHGYRLSSSFLWERFCATCSTIGLDPMPYRVFFERQFPYLSGGTNPSSTAYVKEGRRPRVITDVQKRGETVISKTIDTRHKRLEIHIPPGTWEVRYGDERLKPEWFDGGDCGMFALLDLFVEDKTKLLTFHWDGVRSWDPMNKPKSWESPLQGRFNPFNMTWE